MKWPKTVDDYIGQISDRPLLDAIRRGFAYMIPIMMIGSFALFVNNLPIPAYQEFMVRIFGDGWRDFGGTLYQGTFSVMSLGMLLTIAYSMAYNESSERNKEVSPIVASMVAMACLISLTAIEDGRINLSWLGTLGVFVAVITASTSTSLFLFLSRCKVLRLRVFSNAADDAVTKALASIFPALITVSAFALFRVAVGRLGLSNIHQGFYELIQGFFSNMDSSFASALLFIAVMQVFWFFGIHGSNVLEPAAQSLFIPALAVNQELLARGMVPTQIFTKEFFDVFVSMGGAGTTLALIVSLLIAARQSNTRQIAKISLLPGIINANELMVFGIPIAFNFYYLIPFIFLPPLLTAISYLAMSLGWVPLPIARVEWTTPILLGGYVATGSVAGSILQLFNFCVAIAAYYPFVTLHERHLSRDNQRAMKELLRESLDIEQKERKLTDRRDSVGNLARILTTELKRDLTASRQTLYLEYQPQMNHDGAIHGVEALLRWKHPKFGPIAPPIIIALSEETDIMDDLGIWVLRTALSQLRIWNDIGLDDIILSVNVAPSQLNHPGLSGIVQSLITGAGVNPHDIELEITERAAIVSGTMRMQQLYELRTLGVRLAMDDFGAGHSSLMVLKEFELDTIKLDGELVRDMVTNANGRGIIATVLNLCKSIHIDTVAEYVETEEQRDMLLTMGCTCYQGWLYSKSLMPDDFVAYYREHATPKADEAR